MLFGHAVRFDLIMPVYEALNHVTPRGLEVQTAGGT